MKRTNLLEFLELKRPIKLPHNGYDGEHSDTLTDNKEITVKERRFVRNYDTLPTSRGSRRYKKKSLATKQTKDSTKMSTEEVTNVKLQVQKFETLIKEAPFRRSISFCDKGQISSKNEECVTKNKQEYKIQKSANDGSTDIHKNNRATNEIKSINISKKKEPRKKVRSFTEAETDDETEFFRQKLLQEMDKYEANMKKDGFIKNDDVQVMTSEENIFFGTIAEDFSETLGDDLENGSYFVEAYNDDGRELILVQISINRKAVNLNCVQTIQEVLDDSEIVLYENENRMLRTVTDPEDFVNNITSDITTLNPVSTENEKSVYVEMLAKLDKRPTTYSIASNDSSTGEDDSISTSYESVYGSGVRRETFCDNFGNVRIERIGYLEQNNESIDVLSPAPLSRNNSITPTKK